MWREIGKVLGTAVAHKLAEYLEKRQVRVNCASICIPGKCHISNKDVPVVAKAFVGTDNGVTEETVYSDNMLKVVASIVREGSKLCGVVVAFTGAITGFIVLRPQGENPPRQRR